ncbi:MAG: SIS domain-containing protein [Candidatus Zixiibacteriota bacterium]
MTKKTILDQLRKLAAETAVLRKNIIDEKGTQIVDLAAVISGVIGSGGKILIAGNGGSAADASHFAAEMVIRLTGERNRQALPAIALCTDPAVLTAGSNDLGFEHVFSRQVEALGQKGDMLIVISTSGNSQNLINAVRTARDRGLLTMGLLGRGGGKLAGLVERSLVVPHASVQRIQEEHIFIIHLLVELVEGDLFV